MGTGFVKVLKPYADVEFGLIDQKSYRAFYTYAHDQMIVYLHGQKKYDDKAWRIVYFFIRGLRELKYKFP